MKRISMNVTGRLDLVLNGTDREVNSEAVAAFEEADFGTLKDADITNINIVSRDGDETEVYVGVEGKYRTVASDEMSVEEVFDEADFGMLEEIEYDVSTVIIEQKNGRGMELYEWDTLDDTKGGSNYIAELTVIFDDDTTDMIIKALEKQGISRELYDSGDLVIFAEAEKGNGDIFITDGGYPVINPDLKSDVYLLTESSELASVGMVLDKDELDNVIKTAKTNISNLIQKEQAKNNIDRTVGRE